MESKPKIVIGTPCYNMEMNAQVAVTMAKCILEWSKDYTVSWRVPVRTFICKARHAIVREALQSGADYILWADDDAIIDPSFLNKLIAHGKEIVITPYFLRDPPYLCGVLKSETGDFMDQRTYRNIDTDDLDKGLIEVDGGGTHCMLTSTKIYGPPRDFQEQPLEEYSQKYPGKMPLPWFVLAPSGGTEDMYMCWMAKRVGLKIYCDSDIHSPHIGYRDIITPEHRKSWKGKFGNHTLNQVLSEQLLEDGMESKQLPAWKFIGACNAAKSEVCDTSKSTLVADVVQESSPAQATLA